MVTRTLPHHPVIAVKHIRSLRHAWHEARPVVQFIFMLRFAAGAALGELRTEGVLAPAVFVSALSWLATTWAVYLFNGVADIVEDRANASARPIARGELTRETAEKITWILATTGLVLGALVSPVMLLLVALMLMVGGGYSGGPRPFKNSLGGFLNSVIALGLLTYLAGWHSSGAGELDGAVLPFGIAMSVWMGLGGATKDLSDVEGDRLAGRRTLPVLLGAARARAIMAVAASLVGWTFLAVSACWSPHLLPAATAVCAGSIVLSVLALTSLSNGDRAARRRPYRAFMMTQYAAHVTLFLCIGLPGFA